MAELVQGRMESMTDEIEEMRRTKLYSLDEIRYILKTRKDFEYKINGTSKSLKDFKDYIVYEKVLLQQIQRRRDKTLIGERKSGIEYKILKRIKNLYDTALQRWSNDFSFALSYFKFCKQSNFTNAASIAVQNMIKNCSQNPEVWQVAANWFAHDRNDFNTAVTILNKSLTIHRTSQLLYTEAIKLELSVLKKGAAVDDEEQNRVTERIKAYIPVIFECIDNCHYLISILSLLESYPFTILIQDFIIDKLVTRYSDKAFVWNALAQREKRGLHYTIGEEAACDETSPLSLCLKKYQQGLEKVSLSERAALYSSYLDCLIEIHNDSSELVEGDTTELKSAFEKASSDRVLPENYYIKWLELASDEETLRILKTGTTALPQSLDLWKLYLRYAIIKNSNKEVDAVFEEGVRTLKERSLPLWLMRLRFYTLLSKDDIIKGIYDEGVQQPPEVSNVLKPMYIEWLALTKTICEARQKYNSFVTQRPYCKELHSTMLKLESTEIEPNYELWGRVHVLCCEQFGESDEDVWINHILFYLHFNKCDNAQEKIQRIYEAASGRLPCLLRTEFKEKYDKVLSEV